MTEWHEPRTLQAAGTALRPGWALVTGASDGIGRAVATELAAEGWPLILVGRSIARLEAARQAIGAPGGSVRLVALDLATAEGCEALVQNCAMVPLELAVLAAGHGTSGPFLDNRLADELGMIDLNCRAVAHLAHALAKPMVARGRGSLVLMSSLVAFQGVARAVNYAATKAYVQTLAEGLAAELGPKGVAVLAAAPGPVNSGFAARAGMTMAGADAGEVARGIVARIGRSGTVRPGLLSKGLGWSLALLPRWGRCAVMGRVMSGMTGG